jgi:hypothetical protein
MPGMLGYSFRQGDRSEYLALYFLSALGVAVHVPRPEDIGADFQCALARRDGDALTFKAPFLVQTKSSAPNLNINYGRYDNQKHLWPVHQLNWLWSQEIPLLVGIVNKGASTFALYSTSPMWRVRYSHAGNPGEVVLRPNTPAQGTDIGFPDPVPQPQWPPGTGDGQRWFVDLGPPLISITATEAENPDIIARSRQILDWALFVEQQNITYRRLNIPYFSWPLKIQTNDVATIGPVGVFIAAQAGAGAAIAEKIRALSPFLFALALDLKHSNQIQQLMTLAPLFELIPNNAIPGFLPPQLPEIFG